MRFSLTLVAASILLVGAGCSQGPTVTSDTGAGVTIETSPVDTSPEPVVDLQASSTVDVSAGSKTEPVACTMDAKACPDGSYVGRTGPNCEFAPCPTVKPVETKPTEIKPVEKPKEEATKPVGPTTYTMVEVKAKAAAGSCWTVISGKVYDLTNWISKHPGGQAAIKSLCGIDGTAKFMAMHAGAAKQESILATYFIGNLK